MSKSYVLFNPYSGNNTGKESSEKLKDICSGMELVFLNVTEIKDYKELISSLEDEDSIIICGGDGTLNRFVNDVYDLNIENEILYYPAGSGNDFLRDMDGVDGSVPFRINEYIKDLPVVTVNGRSYRFINGVGFGIDGYCCEVGDQLRAKNIGKPINYAGIAIKGLLFHYKPTSATVTVDGVTHTYKKAWLAPTMVGRYYGGGMIPTPHQTRDQRKENISVSIIHDTGKLKTLLIFPSIFKGEHIKHVKKVDEFSGKNITVEFNRPVALQIDGETILNVTKYEACIPSVYAKKENTAAKAEA